MNCQPAKWTIMIYANGNNELQPEMWNCKLAVEKVGSNSDVNVVLQVSQEKSELVTILRPTERFPVCNRKWIGARRYVLINSRSMLVKNLGLINMADPLSLYNFIVWAISEYPAEHYMLIVGGHGYQFVGAMTDYSQNAPYIMGIVEMNKAISLAVRETNSQIDIFVMDSCYYNFIEIMYELGKEKSPAIQHVITYIDNGPLSGLGYDRLLCAVQAISRNANSYDLCNALLDSLDFDLVAVRIDHPKLSHIKDLYNIIAQYYEHSWCEREPSLYSLIYLSQPMYPWHKLVMEMHAISRELIIGVKQVSTFGQNILHVATKSTEDQASLALYEKLSFTHNNKWFYLLSNKTRSCEKKIAEIELRPLRLSWGEVTNYISIMNPTLTFDQKLNILGQLCRYKKWW